MSDMQEERRAEEDNMDRMTNSPQHNHITSSEHILHRRDMEAHLTFVIFWRGHDLRHFLWARC